jgi:hypothetical protein
MGSVPTDIGVFFGRSANGLQGWYWTNASISREQKAACMGPFATKEMAVGDAVQCRDARRAPNDETALIRTSPVSLSRAITQRRLCERSRTPRRRLDFWARVRTECSALLRMRSGPSDASRAGTPYRPQRRSRIEMVTPAAAKDVNDA